MTNLLTVIALSLLVAAPQKSPVPERAERRAKVPHEKIRIEKRSQGGAEVAPGLWEYDERLVVDFETRTIEGERHHPSSDERSEPLGKFRAALTDALADKFRRALDAVNFNTLRLPTGGGPGTSMIQIRVVRGDEVQQAAFSSRDFDNIETLQPLFNALNNALFEGMSSPVEALAIEVDSRLSQGRLETSLVARNVGTKPIRFANPQRLPLFEGDRTKEGAAIKFANYPVTRPGYTEPPPEWEYKGLKRADEKDEKVITLAPGQKRVFPGPSFKPSMRVLIQADLQLFRAGGDDVTIRGRASSEMLEIDVP